MHEKYHEPLVEKEMRVLENNRVKILRNFLMQIETKIDHNKPDLILLEKRRRFAIHTHLTHE